MQAYEYTYPVVLVQTAASEDPFAGVERLLSERGVRSARVLPDQPPPVLAQGVKVVVVTEWRSATSRQLLRQARRLRLGVVVVLGNERCGVDDRTDQLAEELVRLQQEVGGRIGVVCQHERMRAGLASRGVKAAAVPADPAGRAEGIVQGVMKVAGRGADVASIVRAAQADEGGGTRTNGMLCAMRRAKRREATDRRVVVNCVVIEDSPVGGVRTWAGRLAHGFAELGLGYEVRTLVVATNPQAWEAIEAELREDDLTDVCVIDPSMDQLACLECVVESIRNVAGGEGASPGIVVPNYSDITQAAAAQLRHEGWRSLMIAHTDDAYYRLLASEYGPFDGAVGVSAACTQWLGAMAAGWGIDAQTIVYGVPVADSPREVSDQGEIQLAYIGRMVQPQKRISDLLGVVDELERRGVSAVLHMVGDGVDLEGWRRQWEKRRGTHVRVEFHGRRDPAWVQTFLKRIDVNVLVSEFEGTSITMLEGMGQGVVPVVTSVRSGASEWVQDGVSGMTGPVGEPERLGADIAELASDRAQLARLGRAAWERVRDGISVESMCRAYASLFDQMIACRTQRIEAARDAGLRLHEPWRWPKQWCEDREEARRALERMMQRVGYARVSWGVPGAGSDAVIVDAEREALTPGVVKRMDGWRAEGLGVVVWPHLMVMSYGDDASARSLASAGRMIEAARRAVTAGCQRIVIYGIGKHTRRLPGVFVMGLPIVGLMDDQPSAWEYMFGLPVVRTADVIDRLSPDAVIVSSDAWEEAMWKRTGWLREAGVKVLALYGAYEEEAMGAAQV